MGNFSLVGRVERPSLASQRVAVDALRQTLERERRRERGSPQPTRYLTYYLSAETRLEYFGTVRGVARRAPSIDARVSGACGGGSGSGPCFNLDVSKCKRFN